MGNEKSCCGALNPDSRTSLYCLLGNPVKESLSPLMYNAAFSDTGFNGCYLSFEVEPSFLEEAIKGLRACVFGGCNVTIPFKKDIIPYIDHLSEEAKLIQSVNTVVNREGALCGYTTDGEGFCRFLAENHISPLKKEVLILGAGGAAVAVSYSLAKAGASSVTVANRTLDRAIELVRLIESNSGVSFAKAVSLDPDPLNDALRTAHIVVNCLPFDLPALLELSNKGFKGLSRSFSNDGVVFADIRYNPDETELMAAFRRNGASAFNGREMLLWQAVLAFEIFTGGEKAPVHVMKKAINI